MTTVGGLHKRYELYKRIYIKGNLFFFVIEKGKSLTKLSVIWFKVLFSKWTTLEYTLSNIEKRIENLRDLLEATSSQKVCATSISTGDQGGAPTLGQWPQCYRVWKEIEIFQRHLKNLNSVLNYSSNRDYYTIVTISKWIFSVLIFLMNL